MAGSAAVEAEPVSEEEEASHMAMFVADLLRADISNLVCLQCGQEEAEGALPPPAAPCYATIHPFCDAFHRWLCRRLLSDGGAFSCAPEDLLRSAGAAPETGAGSDTGGASTGGRRGPASTGSGGSSCGSGEDDACNLSQPVALGGRVHPDGAGCSAPGSTQEGSETCRGSDGYSSEDDSHRGESEESHSEEESRSEEESGDDSEGESHSREGSDRGSEEQSEGGSEVCEALSFGIDAADTLSPLGHLSLLPLPRASGLRVGPHPVGGAACGHSSHQDASHGSASVAEGGGAGGVASAQGLTALTPLHAGPPPPLPPPARYAFLVERLVIDALESCIGDPLQQRNKLLDALGLLGLLPKPEVPRAASEVLFWYNCISSLACSFASSDHPPSPHSPPPKPPAPPEWATASQALRHAARAADEAWRRAQAGGDPSPMGGKAAQGWVLGEAEQALHDSEGMPVLSPSAAPVLRPPSPEWSASRPRHVVELSRSLATPPLPMRGTPPVSDHPAACRPPLSSPLQIALLASALDTHAGQWSMGLQGLRESPYSALADACRRAWRLWRRSHRRVLRRSSRRLAATARPSRLLHEWLAINEYCDAEQDRFVARFSKQVLHEWYARAGYWCQGSANLVHALLVGVDAWQRARDFMNTRTRQFRSDPPAEAVGTEGKLAHLLQLLRDPPHRPFAVYVELDCWYPDEDEMEHQLPPECEAPPAAGATPGPAAPSVSPGGGTAGASAAWAAALGEQATGYPPARSLGAWERLVVGKREPPVPETEPSVPETKPAGMGSQAEGGADPAAPVAAAGESAAARENALRIAALEQQLAHARAAIEFATAGGSAVSGRRAGDAVVERRLRAASKTAADGEVTALPPEGVFFSGHWDGASVAGQQHNGQQQNGAQGDPTANAPAFRANGGHVFVIQVEGEAGTTPVGGSGMSVEGDVIQEGEAGTGGGSAPPSASEYTIYSSWTGEYTLQEWMHSRPELAQMGHGALEAWMRELGLLLGTPAWSADALARVALLFGVSPAPPAPGATGGGVVSAREDADAATGAAADAKGEFERVRAAGGVDGLAAASARAGEAACRARAANAHACAVAAHCKARERSGVQSCGGDEPWRNPASGWRVGVDEPVLWELHFWAQGYDGLQTEEHAMLIEQLHLRAMQDHAEIVSLIARDNLRKLDLLQSSTLAAIPFGHRCARGWFSPHHASAARAVDPPSAERLAPSTAKPVAA